MSYVHLIYWINDDHSLWSIEKTYLKRYLKIGPSNPNSYTVSLLDSIFMLNSSPKLFKHFKMIKYNFYAMWYMIIFIKKRNSSVHWVQTIFSKEYGWIRARHSPRRSWSGSSTIDSESIKYYSDPIHMKHILNAILSSRSIFMSNNILSSGPISILVAAISVAKFQTKNIFISIWN